MMSMIFAFLRKVGEPVGMDGEPVGALEGLEVVGDFEGDLVGREVVGDREGDALGA